MAPLAFAWAPAHTSPTDAARNDAGAANRQPLKLLIQSKYDMCRTRHLALQARLLVNGRPVPCAALGAAPTVPIVSTAAAANGQPTPLYDGGWYDLTVSQPLDVAPRSRAELDLPLTPAGLAAAVMAAAAADVPFMAVHLDVHVEVRAVLRRRTVWAEAGHVAAHTQLELPPQVCVRMGYGGVCIVRRRHPLLP